jgi:hypothetical protein
VASVNALSYQAVSDQKADGQPKLVQATTFLNIKKLVFIPLTSEESEKIELVKGEIQEKKEKSNEFWSSVDTLVSKGKDGSKKRFLVSEADDSKDSRSAIPFLGMAVQPNQLTPVKQQKKKKQKRK